MRWPLSKNRYLDEFFRLRCASDMLRWQLFPNAKELTESFSAYDAVRSVLDDFRLNDPGVTMVAVGDGSTPRTAATFALRTAWRCISVDPRLKCHWSSRAAHRWSEIRRLELQRTTIERAELCLEGPTVIVAVHSHAKLTAAVAACSGASSLAVVAIPCCVPQELQVPPCADYPDPGNLSPQRTVRVWRKV
jgi:hypothetical protein